MNELKTLKEKMLAIKNGNLDLGAQDQQIVKCWERLNCQKTDCRAYGKLRCWAIAGTMCRGEVQGVFAQKLGDCCKCVVYKESCGDELGELLEIFYQMIDNIKFNANERERTSKEQARKERLAELGDMIAAVAHETRNPLHAIGLAASCLKKNSQGEPVSELLTIIEEEVVRLNSLTSLFIDFSHPAPLNMEACDLNVVIAKTVDNFRKEAAGRKITLATILAPELPTISSDPGRMRAIIANLLDNALDASKDGDTITVATRSEKNFLRITVQDAGPGIAPEDREKVFRPFYTTKSRGLGLGLAIVKRSVKELNGEIELDSPPGGGSLFSILLPLATGKD